MKNHILKNALILFALAFIFASCNSEHPGFKKTKTGLFYKMHISNPDSIKPLVGDLITLEMVYRTSEDSIFSDTRTYPEPLTFPLQEPMYVGDFNEALAMLSKGDSATFVINTDSFFLKVGGGVIPPFLDSGSFFYIDVKVIDIKLKDESERENIEKMQYLKGKEQKDLIEYISKNNIETKPTASGLYMIEENIGKGNSPIEKDVVIINYDVSLIDGMKFYSSKEAGNGEPLPYQVGIGQMGIGFDEAIMMMKAGGKAKMIIPSHLAFGEEQKGEVILPYSTLVFDVELVEVTTEEEYMKKQEMELEKMKKDESSNIKKYLIKNNIKVQPNSSGLYYVETEKGKGKKAEAGKVVKVHYKGMLLDGTKFDASYDRGEPYQFQLGAGQVIQGWDEGIAMMNEGGKAKLIIPSKLAYGDRGNQNIKPYSSLVFEVELVEVK